MASVIMANVIMANELQLKKDCKLIRIFQMWSLLQKTLKYSKVFYYINLHTQSKRVTRIRCSKEPCRFKTSWGDEN